MCVATCVPTAAQVVDTGASSGRPYRGLFGGAVGGSAERPHTLNVTGAVFAGYDDDIFARGQGIRSSNARVGGQFVGSQLSANYMRRHATSTFTLDGATSVRWLESTREFVPTFYSASAGYTADLGPKTNFRARQTAAYRPRFGVSAFAGGGLLEPSLQDPGAGFEAGDMGDLGLQGPDDFALAADRQALMNISAVQLSQRLTRRAGLQVDGVYRVADFRASELNDVSNTQWRAGGGFNYDITTFATAQLGYRYQTLRARDGESRGNHNINVGVRYAQPFVFQRGRTQFSFTTGSSLVSRERLGEDGGGQSRLLFRGTGSATLMHAFTAPWQAQLNYTRYVGFIDGLSNTVEGDRVMAGLGGLITQRLELSMSAGYQSGAIGLRQRNFDTALASVRLRAGLTQNLALFAQYFYFQASFDESVIAQLIVPPELERQGVRAGLTVWWPLIR